MKTNLVRFGPAETCRKHLRVAPPGFWLHIRLLSALIVSLSALTLVAREIPMVAPAKARLAEAKLAEVDQFMDRSVAEQKIAGGIVMVSHQGKIGFFHSYGQMDREVKKPMQPDTIFRIYSMSKAITTAAALTLYDAHQLGLDDSVSKYSPSFAHLKVAATNGIRSR